MEGCLRGVKKWDMGLCELIRMEECVPWCGGVSPAQQAVVPHFSQAGFVPLTPPESKDCVILHTAISYEKQ